ncbi:MAG: hypothetical protein LBC74_07265 [Planctomycetaceae bacterium]|jgi:hypothetical protein|nr:hypothetical protein [Planctomycetaceae bacterium]
MKNIRHDSFWHHMNGFGVGATWTRYDSDDISAKKTSDFLNDFVKLHPDWVPFRMYSSIKGALTSFYSEIPTLPELRKIIEEGLDKYAYGYGSHIFFENVVKQTDQRKLVQFNLTCGAYDRQSNGLSIKFPPYNEEAKHITTKEVYIVSLKLIIKHWNPYRGSIGIPFFMIEDYKSANDMADKVPEVSWFNYFSAQLGELPQLPDWVIITPVDGLGNYIQVSEDLPDKTNENELHNIITKVYELSELIKPWIKSKWELIISSEL